MDIDTLLSSLEGSNQKISVPVDPSYGDVLSNDDQKIFDAVLELCERAELFAVEPVIFFEGVGIYKYNDLFFERVVVDLYDPPIRDEREYQHYLQRLTHEEAKDKQKLWKGEASQIVSEFKDFGFGDSD